MSREDPRHLNVRLIDRHRLDLGPGLSQDGHDHYRLGFVFIHPRRNEHAIGTKPSRSDAGHSRTHPKFSSLVAFRAYDTTLVWWTPDNHRLAAKGRIIPLFHGGVESIHVEMEDYPTHDGIVLCRPAQDQLPHFEAIVALTQVDVTRIILSILG